MPSWISASYWRLVLSAITAAVLFPLSVLITTRNDSPITLPILVFLLSILISRAGKQVKRWKWLCGGVLVLTLLVCVDQWERTDWCLLLLAYPIGNWLTLIWYGRTAVYPSLMIIFGFLLIPVVIDEVSLYPVSNSLSVLLATAAGILLGQSIPRTLDRPSSRDAATGRWKRAVVGVVLPACTAGVLWAVFVINNSPPQFIAPATAQLKVNGWHDFVRAAEMIKIDDSLPSLIDCYEDDRELSAKYTALYERHKAALPVIRQGLGKPFRHPYTYNSCEDEQERPLIAPGQAGAIARLLAAEAVHYQRVGEYDKAAGSCLDIVQFGVRLPQGERLIISSACTVETYGLSRLAGILPKLGAPELELVAQRLESIQESRMPLDLLLTEAANQQTEFFVSCLNDKKSRRWWANPYHWFGPDMEYYLNGESWASQSWRNTRLAFCSKQKLVQGNYDYMIAFARECRKPYSEQVEVAFPNGDIADLYYTSFIRDRSHYTGAQARIAIMMTAIALRRHLLGKGTYPQTLAELVPVYLEQLPVDPFCSNRSLVYKRTGADRFLLYSRGPDMKDDGGRSTDEDDISFDSLLPKSRPKPAMPPMPPPGLLVP